MATRFLKISVVYFAIAVILGLVMGIIQNFTFTSVHAHLNLLGWVSMALFGVIYTLYPAAANTSLAKTHFWLHNIGLPLMQGSLFIDMVTGAHNLLVVTIVSSIALVLGVILFATNILMNVSANKAVNSSKNASM